MNRKMFLILGLGACLNLTVAYAQKKAPPSPPAQTSAAISGKKITIDYSAPSLRGRKMLGGNNPYGQVWRTGANTSTTLTTEADLDLGGLKVPHGKYSIYSLPEAGSFTLIVNKQTGQWGTEYNQGQDLGRVKMKVSHASSPVETLKISLLPTGGNKGELKIEWGNDVFSLPFTAH